LTRRGHWTRTSIVLGLLNGGLALGAPHTRSASDAWCGAGRNAYDRDISAAVQSVASVWSLPSSLIKAVIQRESAFNPTALSRAGAIGLMQVLPSNAVRLGLAQEALWTPRDNILAGTRLLAVLLRHYQGDVISALVAYNARPRPRFAPLPDNGETPFYVRAVLRSWASFERCAGQRPYQRL
jgi:soluble lytic murein transglycosylase-like protein